MRTLLALVLAQAVSGTGSQMAGFALAVWLYQRTGSTTVYGLVAAATLGPMVLFGPFAGVLVDRWDRRRALIAAHAGGGLCSVVLALLHWLGAIGPWTVMLPLIVSACFTAFQFPAISAATTTLVPSAQLGRANGLVQLGFAVSQLAGPVTSGALLPGIGLGGILLLDVGSFLFAVVLLSFVRVPRPTAKPTEHRTGAAPWREMAAGWAFLRGRPGLIALVGFFAAVNFGFGVVEVILAPLVLGFADSRALGAVFSIGGVGMVAGSLTMTAWGGPRRCIHGVLGFTLLQGLLMLLGAARPSLVLAGVGAFGVMFTLALINGCNEPIWQRKVPPELQGRVSSLRTTVATASLPLAFSVAGALNDRIFEPLMAESGPLAASVGGVLGTGRGRGAALLFVVLAGMTILAVVGAFLYPRLRRVEVELPDHSTTGEGPR